MPTFHWTEDPIAFTIPRDPALVVIGLIGLFMLVSGLRNKQGDVALFGVLMGGFAALASNFLPDPLEIRYYSLLFVGVFLGGYYLLNWQIQRGGGSEEAAGDFIVYGVLGVLLGARLGHVLFYDLEHALRDPLWIVQIWTGGLASHGAVIGLVVAMYLFTKRRGIPFLEGADRFAFSAALGATLVRLGNFFNSEIVGKKTDGTWGVYFPYFDGESQVVLRHPSQFYEAALGLLVLGSLFLADRAWGKEKRPRGALISLFFVLYFAGRFTVEFFKERQIDELRDSVLSMGQMLSIPGFLLGVVGLVWAFRRRLPAGWQQPEPDDFEDDESEDRGERRLYDPDVEDEFDSEDDDSEEDEDDEESNRASEDDASEDDSSEDDASKDDASKDDASEDDEAPSKPRAESKSPRKAQSKKKRKKQPA